jgi:hypothetical protein
MNLTKSVLYWSIFTLCLIAAMLWQCDRDTKAQNKAKQYLMERERMLHESLAKDIEIAKLRSEAARHGAIADSISQSIPVTDVIYKKRRQDILKHTPSEAVLTMREWMQKADSLTLNQTK